MAQTFVFSERTYFLEGADLRRRIEELDLMPGQERAVKVWYCPMREADVSDEVAGDALLCFVVAVAVASSFVLNLMFHAHGKGRRIVSFFLGGGRKKT